MQRHDALELKEFCWSHGREACLFCVKDDAVLSDDQAEITTLPDGTSVWDGEWLVCVDGKRSPFEYAKAVIWLDEILFMCVKGVNEDV